MQLQSEVQHEPELLCDVPRLVALRVRQVSGCVGVQGGGVGVWVCREVGWVCGCAGRWGGCVGVQGGGVGVWVCREVKPVLHCGQKPGVHSRTETQRWPLGP